MYCKVCGGKIDDDSLFCSFCGTKQSITNKPIFANDEDQSITKNVIEYPDNKLIPYRKGKKWDSVILKKKL